LTHRLVLASSNTGKILEIRALLSCLPIELLTLEDFTDWPELEEKGNTFEENAISKATTLSRWSGQSSMSDDSGLEVDALNGEPGVLSARYAGVQGDSAANIARLLKEMKGVPEGERGARFVCVIALVRPDGEALSIRETCDGEIIGTPRGDSGFGYDPIFVPVGMEKTMADLSLEEKNAVSHRGKALRRLREMLEKGEPPWL
jgi:XTP/dITP diphosphohydrolase